MQEFETKAVETALGKICSATTDCEAILKYLNGKTSKVCVLHPATVDIPASNTVLIGTPLAKIDELIENYADLEVQPDWIRKQAPQHTVSVKAFKMAVFTVTNLEWTLFKLGSACSEFERQKELATMMPSQLFHPKIGIDEDAAVAFIGWLNATSHCSYRLPTEREWEYAVSGGDGRMYPWGDEWLPGLANTAESGVNHTLPVHFGWPMAQQFPNGLVQAAGNVEELTSTRFHFYQGLDGKLDGFAELDPNHLVTRGGSFQKWRDLASCQRRHSSWHDSAIGMRLVRDID